MIKIHIDKFYANNPELTIDDIITNIRAGITPEGVVNIHFGTSKKYYDIEANGTTYTPDYTGKTINIRPFLYQKEDPFNSIEPTDDEYYEHPDYFCLTLVVDESAMRGKYFTSRITALKHEYFVSFVPDDMIMNYDCLEAAELIEWESE